MASGYHLIVKKYLDQNRIGCSLPEYIQRGWHRIYTSEEHEFNKRPCIIGPDVQIPNSTVRHRLGTTQMLVKANIETLRKAFELPDELFMNLSTEHKIIENNEDDKLSFEWDDDDDDDNPSKRKKSAVDIILTKQREKRRKYDEYKYDYDAMEPLSLTEIIEEIRTNVGKHLQDEDLKLITELMQIISQQKQDQVMNIYDEFTNVQLINKFGGVPKLVQALQEVQKAFEQVAMKTNIASIETVIDLLLEKDDTYRVAVEMLKSFNENTKKNKQKLKLNDKSAASDLTTLIHGLETVRSIDSSKINNDHDEQVKFLSEELNMIFTRAHLDGIKTVLHSMKSPISVSLRDFIDKIEKSLNVKLTEEDNIITESYIHDRLSSLNKHEIKSVYERLAQQGTLKRHINSGDLIQTITMGLMKKIDTDGLGAVIENINEAHLDIDSIKELIQSLTRINDYIQTQPSVPLEQIQNQLGMAYFIETRNLTEQNIHVLSEVVELYSIAHITLAEEATSDQCLTFLEHLKAPFLRICMQRILNEGNSIDLNKVSNRFYNEHIIQLFNELTHGSDEFIRNLFLHQTKEQLKKTKELPDKLYRQMIKEKFIPIDTKVKIDTDKKKIQIIIKEINQILMNDEDRMKQQQLVELFDKIDIVLPVRMKHWYKTKSSLQALQSSSYKLTNAVSNRKINVKSQIKLTQSKTKSVMPSAPSSVRRTDKPIGSQKLTVKERSKREIKDQLPSTTVASSSKNEGGRKGSLVKSPPKIQQTVHQEKEHSGVVHDPVIKMKSPTKTASILANPKTAASVAKNEHRDTTISTDEKEKTKVKSQISSILKPEEQKNKTSIAAQDQSVISSSTTITADAFDISKPQVKAEIDEPSRSSTEGTKETTELIDSLMPKQEESQEGEKEQTVILANVVKETSPSGLSSRAEILSTIGEQPKDSVSSKQPPDHQSSNTEQAVAQEIYSEQDTSTSDTILNSMQTVTSPDSEQKTGVQLNNDDQKPVQSDIEAVEEDDLLQQPEKYSVENYVEPIIIRSEMFQADIESIRPETTISGRIEDNKTLNFDLSYDTALLSYNLPLSSDPNREMNTILIDKPAETVTDPQYEKTKAQRVLAKTIPTNIARQQTEGHTVGTSTSSSNLTIRNSETVPASTERLSGPAVRPPDDESFPPPSSDNIRSSAKVLHRPPNKSIKPTEDIYINSLTKALRNLFSRSEYDNTKLRKIHEELISSGHISPLNEFYLSTNDALRVTLDHCVTYDDLIKWTLSLLQSSNKPNLLNFGHNLYSIAIELDLTLIDRVDNTRCAVEIQENLRHELQTITETDLREINSYLNAAQLEKIVNVPKKLNVTSKDRMMTDLNTLLLHLIQACHTFEPKYRPMQTRIREVAETFKSRAVGDLARKIDEIEKRLAKNFSVTVFGISKRLNESRFIFIK